jgi:hypothetical protein
MMASWFACATTTGSLSLPSSACRARSADMAEPFTSLRFPKIFNLRTDPYERADITSNTYWDWVIDRVYLLYAGQSMWPNFWQRSRMKLHVAGTVNILNVEHRTPNIERRILMTLRFIDL